jgi:hypothetical protein
MRLRRLRMLPERLLWSSAKVRLMVRLMLWSTAI